MAQRSPINRQNTLRSIDPPRSSCSHLSQYSVTLQAVILLNFFSKPFPLSFFFRNTYNLKMCSFPDDPDVLGHHASFFLFGERVLEEFSQKKCLCIQKFFLLAWFRLLLKIFHFIYWIFQVKIPVRLFSWLLSLCQISYSDLALFPWLNWIALLHSLVS